MHKQGIANALSGERLTTKKSPEKEGAIAEWSKALLLRVKLNENQETPGSPLKYFNLEETLQFKPHHSSSSQLFWFQLSLDVLWNDSYFKITDTFQENIEIRIHSTSSRSSLTVSYPITLRAKIRFSKVIKQELGCLRLLVTTLRSHETCKVPNWGHYCWVAG